MGVCLSWIAVKGRSPQEVHTAIGVHPTGRREDSHQCPNPRLSAAVLPNEFYLVVFNRDELSPRRLTKYSTAVDLLYGFAEEHVMYSSVAEWSKGEELWSVVHDAQEGILHLKVNGSPPAGFAAIRDRLIAAQSREDPEDPGVDCVFDIPVELARELTGYRYDQEIEELGAGAFDVLEPTQKTGFARWNPFRR